MRKPQKHSNFNYRITKEPPRTNNPKVAILNSGRWSFGPLKGQKWLIFGVYKLYFALEVITSHYSGDGSVSCKWPFMEQNDGFWRSISRPKKVPSFFNWAYRVNYIHIQNKCVKLILQLRFFSFVLTAYCRFLNQNVYKNGAI